jgi:hypothetical protein
MLNRLTERTCATAKPEPTREVRLFDGAGLYLAVRPSGAKAWKLKYSFRGAEKKLTLGPCPLLSLKEARAARDRAKLQLAAGNDPGEHKKATRRRTKIGKSFEAIARAWHASRRAKLTSRYAEQVLARLEANAFPSLGPMPIGEITPANVLEAVRPIEARGAPVMAQEVRGHISEVFVYAIASGLATSDPAAIIRKALALGGGGRRAALLRIEKARALIGAIDSLRRARTGTKLASRLLALTAVRPGVVRLAERQEFEGLDGDLPLWRVPAAKMKLTQARKSGPAFDFVVPLSAQALGTVRAAMAESDHPAWLFPGDRWSRGERAPISDSTLSQLYLDAGYRGRHVPHGWRATFSRIMNERAAEAGREGDRAIIDLMLAHVKGDVEAAYNRAAYMPRRRELAQEWADLLLTGLPPSAELLDAKRR